MENSQPSVDDPKPEIGGSEDAVAIPKIEVRLTSDPSPPSFASRLTSAIAPILLVGGYIGALLLSLGWSFAWHWFATWNVPFTSLGVGPDVLLEYGRIVVLHHWWQFLVWVALGVAGMWAIIYLNLGKGFLTLFCLSTFLVPWLASHSFGKRLADAEVQQIQRERFVGLPVVNLYLEPGLDEALNERARAALVTGPNLCHRLLYKALDGLWLLRLPRYRPTLRRVSPIQSLPSHALSGSRRSGRPVPETRPRARCPFARSFQWFATAESRETGARRRCPDAPPRI